jgi:hypothetical protein
MPPQCLEKACFQILNCIQFMVVFSHLHFHFTCNLQLTENQWTYWDYKQNGVYTEAIIFKYHTPETKHQALIRQ